MGKTRNKTTGLLTEHLKLAYELKLKLARNSKNVVKSKTSKSSLSEKPESTVTFSQALVKSR